MAELTLIGTGSACSVERFNTGAMVETTQGLLCIDAGHTLNRALHAQGRSILDVDAVLLTHCHADHMYGLERLGSQRLFGGQSKPVLYLHPSLETELWEHSLKGSMGKIGEGERELRDYFEVRHWLEGDTHAFGDLTFEGFAVRHTPDKPCFGFFLGGRVFYSGDTKPIPEVLRRYAAEIIFHDLSLYDQNPVHATLPELLVSYTQGERDKMWLMSYEDSVTVPAEMISAQFKGLAEQGLTVTL